MKLKCPCCGASMSLDALIGHDDARAALVSVVSLGGDLTKSMMRYVGLFRPAKTDLSFARVTKLIGELLPDIRSGRISRDGKLFDAPEQAWVWAFEQTLNARGYGNLQVPLKGHGYLYEVLSRWNGQGMPEVSTGVSENHTHGQSQTSKGLSALEALKNG